MIRKLTDADYRDAAKALGCEVAAIKAVAEVEAAGDGFLPNGEPKILFEAHIFSRLTGHRFDTSNPQLSSLKWNKSLYAGGAREHKRLQEAVKLDKDAALQSASWGKFQVLGENWKEIGYPSLQAFINDAYDGEAGHLRMFVRFVKARKLDDALRTRNWPKFAAGYNGLGYAANQYDKRMAAAYLRLSR